MMEAMMEDPLAPQPQLNRVVCDVKDCIGHLRKESDELQGPVTDDSQVLHKLCAKLEFLLQTGLKDRTGLLGGKKDYFNYFSDCLSSSRAIDDGLKFVKTLAEVKTQLGKGRAFIRFALVHQRLADTLQQCVMNQRMTSEWYYPVSVWHHPQLYSELIGSLYDLNDIKFDLSPRGYDLDASWPTFARKNFSNSWSMSSRTSSISSLASAVDMPTGGSSEYTSSNERLRNDLAHSESLRTKLEEENDALQNKAVLLEGQLLSLQDQCKQLETSNEKVKKQLSLTEQAWLEKEAELEHEIKTLKKTQGEAKTNSEEIPPEDSVSGAEARLKQKAANQQTMALHMEITSLQKDLASKDTVSQTKDRLIDALEAKLGSAKSTNADLISKLKMLIDEKNRSSAKWIESAKELETLTNRVVTSEKENLQLRREVASMKKAANSGDKTEIAEKIDKASAEELAAALKANESLKRINTELRGMLSSLEEKSKKIANVAKEKVIGYSEENARLKAELSSLQQSSSGTAEKETVPNGLMSVSVTSSTEENNKQSREEELCESLRASEALNQEIKQEIERLRHELEMRESTFDTEKGEITEHMESLRKQNHQQSAELESANVKLQQLESEKKAFEENLVKMEGEKMDVELQWREKLNSKEAEMSGLREELEAMKSHQISVDVTQNSDNPEVESSENLHIQIQSLQHELEALNMNYKAAQSEKDGLKTQLEESLNTKSALHSRLSELENQILATEKEVDSCSQTQGSSPNAESVGTVNQSSGDLMDQTLPSDVNVNCDKTDSLSYEEHKQTVSERLQGSQASADSQVPTVMNKINEKIRTISQQNIDLENSEKSLKGQIEELNKVIVSLESDKSELIENMHLLEEETSKILDKRLTKLQEKLLSEKEARTALESEMSKLKNANSENDSRLKVIEDEKRKSMKKAHKQQVKNLQGKVDNLTREKEELLREAKETKKQIQHLESDLQSVTLKNDDLQKMTDKMNEDRIASERQMEELRQQVCEKDSLQLRISEVIQENDNLHSVYQSTLLELSAAKAEAEEGKELINQRYDDADQIREENQKLLEDLDETRTSLSKVTRDFENLTFEKEELAKLYSELQDKTSATEIAMMEFEELQLKNQNTSASLERLKAENAMLNDEVTNLSGDLNDKICESVAMETELRSCGELWEEKKKLYEQEISALKFQLSTEQLKLNEQKQTSTLLSVSEALTQQEKLVESLENQMQQIEEERKQEQDRQWKELAEMKQVLSHREEENGLLHDSLKRTNLLLDEERNTVLKFKNDLRTSHDCLRQKEEEIAQMRSDSAALKCQLVKIIKDKDTLWQKNDQLEHVQRLTTANKWMDNSEVDRCLKCEAEFSIILRKHHCRMCGRIYCNTCCNNRAMTPRSSKKERVCDDCFLIMSPTTPTCEGGGFPTEDSTTYPTQETSSLFHGCGDEGEQTNVKIPQTNTGIVGLSPSSPVASSAEEVSVMSKDEDHEKPDDTEVGQFDQDEHFDVITEEEILEVNTSKDSDTDTSPSETVHHKSSVLSVSDIENGLSDSNTDLWIKAGKSFSVPVIIDLPGIVLCWQFSTQPKGISFSVEYCANETSADVDTLIPLCKCNSHKQAVQGELIARKPGLYTLLFDNTSSRLTSKHLLCKLQVWRPEAAN